MKKIVPILSAAATITLTAVPAQAQALFDVTYSYQASPRGWLVDPPNGSLAFAYGTFELKVMNTTPEEDDVFTYSLSYDTLAYGTAAHIHDQNGDVLLTLNGTINILDGIFIGNTQVDSATSQAIRDGSYVDIHSSFFPNGEVRDSLNIVNIDPPPAVPEANSALLVGGLLVAGAVGMKMRRK